MRMFYHAANWLVDSQNQETGAWHVNVPFNLKKSKYPYAAEMGPGWISAMGSAHAMSVLTRAFRHSGKYSNYDFLIFFKQNFIACMSIYLQDRRIISFSVVNIIEKLQSIMV